MAKIKDLKLNGIARRKELLRMIFEAGGGHTGGSLSSIDILVTLFNEVLNIRPSESNCKDCDKFILSKGHSAAGYYSVLADAGFFPKEELTTLREFGSRLLGHPTNKIPGVDINSGALGHGLSPGVGLALAGKRDQKGYQTCVLMGDGEQTEGSIWEAAMSAGHYELDNLIGILDRNYLEITGDTEKVMRLEPLREKWERFGWSVRTINGHNYRELLNAFDSVPFEKDRPSLVIANTTKGKGVSFMEDKAEWHHKVPTEKQLEEAIEELNRQKDQIT